MGPVRGETSLGGAAVVVPVGLPIYLFFSFLIVGLEGSRHYVEAVVITLAVLLGINTFAGFADRHADGTG